MSPEIAQSEAPITDVCKFDKEVLFVCETEYVSFGTSNLPFDEIKDLCCEKPLSSPAQIKLEDIEREQKNQNAIKFLDEWMSEPDDLGERFWNSFREELNQNPFHID